MSREKIDFRLDTETLKAVDQIAETLSCSRSAVLRRAVKKHVRDVAEDEQVPGQIDLLDETDSGP
jgi:predicted transcriptional regulator